MWSVGNQRFFLGIANGIPGISIKVYLSIIRYCGFTIEQQSLFVGSFAFFCFSCLLSISSVFNEEIGHCHGDNMETVYSTSCRLNHSFGSATDMWWEKLYNMPICTVNSLACDLEQRSNYLCEKGSRNPKADECRACDENRFKIFPIWHFFSSQMCAN